MLGIHYSSAFYSTLLSFFVLKIFGFNWTSIFVRYFGSISRFKRLVQPCIVELEGKKWPRMTKNSVVLHISGTIQHDYYLWYIHLCKMMISPGVFFIFFKILIFWIVKGLKGQKRSKMTKTSVTFNISGTIHHMIVICGTQVWSDNISKQFFHFYKILIFWVVRRVKGQKMTQDDKKQSVVPFYLSNHAPYDLYL